MNRFTTFFIGTIVGAVLMFVSLKYSIIRAGDGHHVIRKSTATLSSVYIDIREFTAGDWRDNMRLAADIANSKNQALQEAVTEATVNNSIDSLFEQLQSSP